MIRQHEPRVAAPLIDSLEARGVGIRVDATLDAVGGEEVFVRTPASQQPLNTRQRAGVLTA
jgi:hypothetical protein